MDIVFIILTIGMLILVSYAKVQQNATKTVGHISFSPDDEPLGVMMNAKVDEDKR